MGFDTERLAALSMGAKEAPDGGNVVITVADLRWLTEQLALRLPSPAQLNEYNQPATEIDNGGGHIEQDVRADDKRGLESD